MDFTFILNHLNNDHNDILIAIGKKYSSLEKIKNAKITHIDPIGFNILCDDEDIRVNFSNKVEDNDYKSAFMKIISNLEENFINNKENEKKLVNELKEFVNSFKSVLISSISKENESIISYAPILKDENNNFYIYISSVANHYHSIKANPDKIKIMFIDDEKDAKSILLRRRAVFEAKATFKNRNDEFNKIFDKFENENPNDFGIKQIRKMQDFELVKLDFGICRYVKDFGGAFDIYPDGKVHFPHKKMPHNIQK